LQYWIKGPERLFHMALAEGASAERALQAALSVLAERPDLWRWDWIVEVLVVPDDATIEQIARLAKAYPAPDAGEALTMLVSNDPNLHLWARVMDFQFPQRRHRVVRTLALAIARIDEVRGR
jgi:hypothetical protein